MPCPITCLTLLDNTVFLIYVVKWKHTASVHICSHWGNAFVFGGRQMYMDACVYIWVCIWYIDVLIYCHAKVDGYPCVLLNASLAVLPQSIIPSLLGHSAKYTLQQISKKLSSTSVLAMDLGRLGHIITGMLNRSSD